MQYRHIVTLSSSSSSLLKRLKMPSAIDDTNTSNTFLDFQGLEKIEFIPKPIQKRTLGLKAGYSLLGTCEQLNFFVAALCKVYVVYLVEIFASIL